MTDWIVPAVKPAANVQEGGAGGYTLLAECEDGS